MPEWIDPVFDRTQADCDNHTAKGVLNASDLNRIEGNMQYINELLRSLSYYADVHYTGKYPWTRIKYLQQVEFNKIEHAISSMRDTYSGTADLPELTLTPGNGIISYQHINIMEYYLYDIKWLIDSMLASAPYCGDYYCGDVIS